MSWDVIIFAGIQGASLDQIPDDFEPPPIVDRIKIHEQISACFHGTDWRDPSWGMYAADGLSIEFNVGAEEVTTSIMLHVRGDGDPVGPIASLCARYSWNAFDTGTGELIDNVNPSR